MVQYLRSEYSVFIVVHLNKVFDIFRSIRMIGALKTFIYILYCLTFVVADGKYQLNYKINKNLIYFLMYLFSLNLI